MNRSTMDKFCLAVLYLLILPCLCDDWTFSCPKKCICKWSNGKKSAICNTLQLTTIPTNLSTEIQVLSLNENHITYLNREEFTQLGFVNLQKIYLKSSKLKYIDRDAFKNLKILIEIDLSDNEIERIDSDTFTGNDRLRILHLSGNPLKFLDENQFPKLPHLRVLDLHNCLIEKIDQKAFINLELLEFLNLKNNQLENLPETIFNHMINLKTLEIVENPWRCDCLLKEFRNWYLKNIKLKSVQQKCEQPFNYKGHSWEMIEEKFFGCEPKIQIFKNNYLNVDLGDNITYSCLISGDPKPIISWNLNGKFLDVENMLTTIEHQRDGTTWSNLTILNITNIDGGLYQCSAKNLIGYATENLSLVLPEIVQPMTVKPTDNFWYFGLILGVFGTMSLLICIITVNCICRKKCCMKNRNDKNFVKFNDQDKQLLDEKNNCEITATTTTNSTTNSTENKSETMETIQNSNKEEFPLNVAGVSCVGGRISGYSHPPPPKYCSNILPNTGYGNIFISVSVQPDTIDNPEQNMRPDLLNLPINRNTNKIVPFATLPRNINRSMQQKNDENIINYYHLEGGDGGGEVSKCLACFKNQKAGRNEVLLKCDSPQYDNMGRRITARGDSKFQTLEMNRIYQPTDIC